MQELAYAYGQRLAMESCITALDKIQNPENKKLMTSVFRLYAISEIREDLGFYMMHGVINPNASASMDNVSIKLVKEMAKNVNFLMSCMNIADAA